ncbi:MAG TPA: GAF domain-containing SpoIIE family protein phosphatase [Tepidisphaeraceae bacterium]
MPDSLPSVNIAAEQMRQVLEVSRMLAVTTDLDALLIRIAHAACAMLSCERASIFLHDASKKQLWTKVALQAQEIRIPDHVGIAGCAFQQNELVHVSRPYDDKRFNPDPDRRTGFITRNLLTVPMLDINQKPVGVLQAVNRKDGDFGPEDQALVRLVADQAGVAIQRYQLQKEAVAAESMRREMDLARQVQQALIPKTLPKIPNTETAGWTRPASVTGGDCFDIWELSDGSLAILIADATGHGIAPALIVSQVRTLLRALCDLERDPHELLKLVNRRMAQDLDPGWFITAFLMTLSPSGLVKWSSAGHGPIFMARACGQKVEILEPFVPPLGVLPELSDDKPEAIQLGEGGFVCVTTDGIFEARNPLGEMFSSETLGSVVQRYCTHSADEMLTTIRDTVEEFALGIEPIDDQTIVVARHCGNVSR